MARQSCGRATLHDRSGCGAEQLARPHISPLLAPGFVAWTRRSCVNVRPAILTQRGQNSLGVICSTTVAEKKQHQARERPTMKAIQNETVVSKGLATALSSSTI
jgi:hypothetical protein